MLLCVVLFYKDDIVVMGVCLRRFCLNMSVVGGIICSELGQCTTGFSGK